MTKRIFTFLLILLSTVVSAQKKPNVIFILVDDMGYGDLGVYGQKLIETPNLDKLAASGIKFNQFYAGTSVCAPSRASLLTGLHTGHSPIRGNYEIEPEGQLPIPDSVEVLSEMFKKANYKTATFGKWGLGFPGSEGDPNKQGMDVFYGYNCQRQSHNYYPSHLWDNNIKVALQNTITNQIQYAPDLIQAKALDFIGKNKSNPFFIYLTYTLPHAALQIPASDEKFEYYKNKFKEEKKVFKNQWDGAGYQPQSFPRAAYATMVSKLDNYVGEVLAKINELGLRDNTIIVFTSDNGPHTEGGNDPAFFNSSGGFKGLKRQLTEGGIRVPLIVSWPSKIKKAQTSDYVGAFWDFFPTFTEITGQKFTQHKDGISILPVLLGKQKIKQHDFLYWEFHENGGRQAVRIGNWKGIRERVKTNPNGPIELYDLNTDLKESINVADKYPEIVNKIYKVMEQEHIEHPKFPLIKKN